MNYCPNCGNKVENGSSFCVACGCKLDANTPIVNNVQKEEKPYTPDDETKANRLGIIAICLYFGGPLILSLFTALSKSINDNPIIAGLGLLLSNSSLAGIVVMIVGRVKYPKNKLLKIMMWIIIITAIIGVIIVVLAIAMCAYSIASCEGGAF